MEKGAWQRTDIDTEVLEHSLMFAFLGAANIGTVWPNTLARGVRKQFCREANKLRSKQRTACWNFQLKMENVLAHSG